MDLNTVVLGMPLWLLVLCVVVGVAIGGAFLYFTRKPTIETPKEE